MLPGPRAAEERLLRALEVELEAARAHVSLLARPLRVVVPSTPLRTHLQAALIRRLGRSALGIRVQTHAALALEVLEAAGEAPPRGAPFFEVAVGRALLHEPVLGGPLEPAGEGVRAVAASVEDFLDAGFHPVHAGALLERLGEERAPDPGAERAGALVRVAARCVELLESLGLAHRRALLVRARECLEARGAGLLPTRHLWLYGFADATGVMLDWLSLLLRTAPASLIASRPPDPAAPGRVETEFTRPLLERLAGSDPPPEPRAAPAPRIELLARAGLESEVGAVALRVRALLDRGARPEGITLVVRTLSGYVPALAVELERLGVPFSGASLGAPAGLRARAVLAALELLERRAALRAQRWLDARADARARDPDLSLALRVLGAERLSDWARLDLAARLGDRSLRLPVRDRLEPARTDGGRRLSGQRRVGRERLLRLQAEARALLEGLEGWPERARLELHRERLRWLLGDALAWRRDPLLAPILEALGETLLDLPGELELERDELLPLVAPSLRAAAEEPRGGAGGGVQVLGVMEARGTTAEHLFVLGMNRGVFPRAAREDPLLPDEERLRLRTLLPELPLKRRARDEERHLFAELLASSPHVTLSWQTHDLEGRERPVSPLVLRLLGHLRTEPPAARPYVLDAEALGVALPAQRHLLEGVQVAGRRGLAALLPEALAARELEPPEAVSRTTPGPAPEALAALAGARIAVLEEMDPPLDAPGHVRLGPYFGLVGPEGFGRGDEPLPITTLERLARCPWRGFLEKRLRLEPLPDPFDALSALGTRVLGSLVHQVLEAIVSAALPEDAPGHLDAALSRAPVSASWPDGEWLRAEVEARALELAAEVGLPFERVARGLAERALRALEAARTSLWSGGPLSVLGAEIRGEIVLEDGEGSARPVHFRADLADVQQGRVRLTDYKTGRGSKKSGTLEKGARNGTLLQAPAYLEALCASRAAPDVEARYLLLDPALDPEQRVQALGPGDAAVREAFRDATRKLLEAVAAGACLPRLVDDKGKLPRECERCRMSLVCLQGESAHRRRLQAWAGIEAQRVAKGAASRIGAACLGLWELAAAGGERAKERA